MGWQMTFDAKGFTAKPDNGAWTWGLELESDADIPVCKGADEAEIPVRTSAHEADKSRSGAESDSRRLPNGRAERANVSTTLTIPRSPAITEWFVNDQRGLEQGWTLSAPAEIRLRVRGNLKASVSPQSISFGGQLTYSGLKAWDATGKTIPTHFDATTEGFAVRYDDAGAQYPLTIDPIAQQAYLKASQITSFDQFGISVAVSNDTVVVGAYGEDGSSSGVNGPVDEGASYAGAAYVFVRSGTTWSQQAYLKASQITVNDQFGLSVAVSGDTVVVGAHMEDGSATGVNGTVNELAQDAGAAYVFVRNGTTWSQQAYLKASQVTARDEFGYSVAISGDTVVVGAIYEDGNTPGVNGAANEAQTDAGAAYVFVRNGTTWTQQAYLKASQVSNSDWFGYSVAIAGDTAVVGAVFEDGSAAGVNGAANEAQTDAGAAYVFVRSGTMWSQQAYLKASQVTDRDEFGRSVSVSGNTVVVGAIKEDGSTAGVNGTVNEDAANAGAAYVFVRSGMTWSQQAYLKAGQVSTSDWFGFSVSVSGDTVVVGVPYERGSATGVNGTVDELALDAGTAYVFARSGTTWSQQAYLKASQVTALDTFGYSVAVSGGTVLVGAVAEDGSMPGVNGSIDEGTFDAGAAYIFTGLGPVFPTVTMSTANLVSSATSLTITGTNFSTTPGNNSVVFTPAGSGTVTAATATSLTITNLSGLTLGALNAVVTTNAQSSGAAVQVATVVVPGIGDPDSLNSNVVGSNVLATAVQPDGKTILAGYFSEVLGQPRNSIARLNPDGTLDAGFNPNVSGNVVCVAVQGNGKILLGGSIVSVGGVARNYVARLNADGTLDEGFNPDANNWVYSLAVQEDGQILLGGAFTNVGVTGRNHIARIAANGTLDAGFNPNANGSVFNIVVQADGKILFGGGFTTLSGTARNYIARVDAAGTLDSGFNPNPNNGTLCMAVQADGKILLSGLFTTVEGTTRNRIARVAADGTLDPGFNPNANDAVSSMAVQADGKILLGGNFTTLGGTVRNYVARVDAAGTLDTGFNPNASGYTHAAVQADGKILLGGWFTTVGGVGRNLFARLLNDPATQKLSAVNTTQVLWARGGSAPEVTQTTFELSTDGGTTYTPLSGTATRVGSTANCQLTSLSLPASGQLRARGRTVGCYYNGSSGVIESVVSFNLIPTVNAISPNIGSASGGTSVTITGTNFIGATGVTFGGIAATRLYGCGPTCVSRSVARHV